MGAQGAAREARPLDWSSDFRLGANFSDDRMLCPQGISTPFQAINHDRTTLSLAELGDRVWCYPYIQDAEELQTLQTETLRTIHHYELVIGLHIEEVKGQRYTKNT